MKIMHLRDLTPELARTETVARIDRRTKFGNPFVMSGKSMKERLRVIEQYRVYAEEKVKSDPWFFEELRGLDLACWCAPLPCHGDVIIDILKRTEKERYDEMESAADEGPLPL